MFKTRWWKRRTQITLIALALLAIFTMLGVSLARCTVRQAWPKTSGETQVSGLDAPVTIVRDSYGIPHIYTESKYDLFFAQGYVHAQDRFWQMALNRQRARGGLTKTFGERAASSDALYQSLDLVSTAQEQIAALDEAALAALNAYSQGVNAWLDEHKGRLPFEFTLLRWRSGSLDPVSWTLQDTILSLLALSWQLEPRQPDPTLVRHITARVGPDRASELLGEFTPPADEEMAAALDASLPALAGKMTLPARAQRVDGSLTANNAALLAIDLPSDLSLPAPWYVVALHTGNYHVMGASAPGIPGVWAGQGDVELAAWDKGRALPLLGGSVSAFCLLPFAFESLDENAPQTLDALQAHQLDTFSSRAAHLTPFITRLKPQGWRQERVATMLKKWDYSTSDPGFPFFAFYQLELARATLADELGDALFDAFVAQGDDYQIVLERIIDNPDDEWWDDVNTPERELRKDILKRAYDTTLKSIGRHYGDLHVLWEWRMVHGTQLFHPLGNTWPWDQLLNHDFAPQGWYDTLNASPGGLPCTGGFCRGSDFYRASGAFGYRQITDASDPDTLWFMLLPGQSGHPFHPHYTDLLGEWLDGEYLPLRTADSPEDMPGGGETLVLSPN